MESKRMIMVRMVLSRGFFILMLLTTGIWYILGLTGSFSPPAMTVVFFALFAAGAVLLFYLLYRHGKPVTDHFLFRCCAAGFVILLTLQLAAASYLEMTTSWDPGGVLTSAKECVENRAIITHTNYFSRFQNNTGLLTIEVLYFFVLDFFNIPIGMYTASLLNIVFTDIAILFMVLFIRKTWDNNRALLYMVISVFFMPNFLYIPVMYTDTMSMVFITLPLYLFSCYLRQERRKIRIIQLAAISLLLCAGTKVKGSVAILLVALSVYLIINRSWRRWLAALLLLVIPFTLASVGFDWSMRAVKVIRADEDIYRFPVEYWVYMGLMMKADLTMRTSNIYMACRTMRQGKKPDGQA